MAKFREITESGIKKVIDLEKIIVFYAVERKTAIFLLGIDNPIMAEETYEEFKKKAGVIRPTPRGPRITNASFFP